MIGEVREALDGYCPDRAARAFETFVVEELSNWYIRPQPSTFWKAENDADKAAAYPRSTSA
jgi:isoleucyl-tRNA synthetase